MSEAITVSFCDKNARHKQFKGESFVWAHGPRPWSAGAIALGQQIIMAEGYGVRTEGRGGTITSWQSRSKKIRRKGLGTSYVTPSPHFLPLGPHESPLSHEFVNR